ncbi:MAG: hypothetical protein Q4C65_02240 [Eubacteriales bacterium]|nr:hypothetical protein [Eubacteriales bacterium]
MRRLKRIGFFLYSCLLFAGGFLGRRYLEETFYPGPPVEQEEEAFVPAASLSVRLAADARMEVVCLDLDSGQESRETVDLPSKYVGMTRRELEECLDRELSALPLSEREKGLRQQRLSAFSDRRIVVERSYQKKESARLLTLCVEDHMVTAYEQDTGALFWRTAIDARSLPAKERSWVLRGAEGVTREQLSELLEFILVWTERL